MNLINYDKELFCKYDISFLKNHYFFDEVSNNLNSYKLTKIKRHILKIEHLDKCIFIESLNYIYTNDGVILSSCDVLVHLIKLSSNFYLLCNYKGSANITLYSILYSFMTNNDYIIDVSKFSFLFKKSEKVSIYKKK